MSVPIIKQQQYKEVNIMSNALKKKSNRIGFNSKDKKILRDNLKLKKEDKAILEMTKHLQLMTYNALLDVFGFKEKRIRKFHAVMECLKAKWEDDTLTSKEMIVYCMKKKIDLHAWINKIPLSKKMALVGKNVTPGIVKYFDAAVMANMLMTVITLKEEFRFSNPMIEKYLEKMDFYIDSYTRKQPKSNEYYLNDNMILDIFREELKLDLITAEKIA